MESIDNTGVSSRDIVLILLREDLRSNKLILGLEALGLEAGQYTLDLCPLVLTLMGFAHHDDVLLDLYREYMDKALAIPDIEQAGTLDVIAVELYNRLLQEREGQHG